jgi:exodeoxyribonuclease VII small subunit
MARKKTTSKIDFEKSLAELEGVVEQLETGDQSLEDALQLFEQGIKLTRTCQQALQNAEEKVTILTQNNSEWQTTDEQEVGDFIDGSK